MLITVHKSVSNYAKKVYSAIYESGFEVEFDEDSSDTLNRRIRNAQLAQFNFILVIGQEEQKNGTVNVRTRDNKVYKTLFILFNYFFKVRGEIELKNFIKKLERFRKERIKDTESVEEFES